MASILLLTADTTHAAYTRTKAALEAGGHTVSGTMASTTAALDTAWGSGFGVVGTVRVSPNSSTIAAWLRDKWSAGVPLIIGGQESSYIGHYSALLGMTDDPLAFANSSVQGQASDTNERVVTSHAIVSGFSVGSLVTVLAGDNFVVLENFATAPHGVEVMDVYSSSVDRGASLLAFDTGATLGSSSHAPTGAVAPARAIFCGWFYAGQTDYSASGKTILDQAVDWLVGGGGPSGVTGTVTAAATAPAVSVSATVALPPATATVTATAPAPTVSIAATVASPAVAVTATVAATASAPTVSVQAVTGGDVTESLAGGLAYGSNIEQLTTHAVDPRTNRVPVRLVVVDRFGAIVTELDRVQMDKVTEQIKDDDKFSFTLATSDPKAIHANPRNGARLPEVQLWRGSVMLGWYVVWDMTQAEDGATATFRCEDVSSYFKERVIDRRPGLDLVRNGNFASGDIDWWVVPNSRTQPVFQTWDVVDVLESSSGKGLRLYGMGSALSPGYIRERRRFTQPVAARYAMPVVVKCRVRLSPDAVLRDDGWVLHVLTASTANIGTVADFDTVSYEQKTLTFNDKYALDRFHEIEVKVEIPPTGIEHIIEVRPYSPKTGYAEFIDFSIKPAEKFAYFNLDQGHIFKHLIEFAQNEDYGKDDLNIIGRTRRTGVYRPEFVREFDQHVSVRSAIDELTSMYRGTDWDVVYWGGGVRQAVVYWPRMGSASGMMFELGGHVVGYTPMGGSLSNSVVVQGLSLSSSARTEAYASDPAKLGGMVLESTFTAEEGTPIKDLDDAAQYALQTYGSPAASLRVQMNPRSTSELIDRVGKGDVVRVVIRDGLTNIDGNYRAVRRYFDPNTDTLEYDLAQEV